MNSIKKENLSKLLLELPNLVNQFEAEDLRFSTNLCTWLKVAEEAMSNLRIPEGSKLVTLRARVLAANDLALKNSNYKLRSELRKYQNALSIEVLEEAESEISKIIAQADETLMFYQKKLEEAITASLLVEIIPAKKDDKNHQEWLSSILTAMKNYQATKPTITYIEASLNMVDRLYIIDMIMDKVNSK